MNAPPLPEPVNAPVVHTRDGSQLLQSSIPLRRYPIPDAPGYALEASAEPEWVYLLELPNDTEVPVPCRTCGVWNPATLSGRHFFFAHEPDAALRLKNVRQVRFHIGRLAFPSGWAASPWFAASSRRQLLRRLTEFTSAFLEQRLTVQPALSRGTAIRPHTAPVRGA